MIFNEKDLQILVAVGLTRSQAKVYLSLARLGRAKAKTIWEDSGVARQDIYRVLTELEEKSLVEKTIGYPTEFSAFPIQDAISILLKHKAQEYKETEEKTKELLNRIRSDHLEKMTTKEYEFTLFTTKDASLHKLHEEQIDATVESVDVIDSWGSFKRAMAVYSKALMKDVNKKVKFRFITEKPTDGETIPKIIQTLKKNRCFELRHVPTRPSTSIRISDGKQVTICIQQAATYSLEAPSLFSDNPCIVAALHDYFELLWSKATEYET